MPQFAKILFLTNPIKYQSVDKIARFFYFILVVAALPLDLNQIKKTKDMKTQIKQVTAATLIVLIFMAVGIKANASTTKLTNSNNTETTLQLEDWMIDETIWNASEEAIFVSETDVALEVENWMTNHRIWHAHHHFQFDTELTLEMESWMTDEAIWTVNNVMAEEELTVEDWMTDSKIWK